MSVCSFFHCSTRPTLRNWLFCRGCRASLTTSDLVDLRLGLSGCDLLSQFVSIACTSPVWKGTAVLHHQWTSAPMWATHLPFINVSHSDTHCPAVTWQIWMYILLLFYKDVNRKRGRCCVCVLHPFHSARFIYYKSRDAVCPYFYFQHYHLVCLYCPNFF